MATVANRIDWRARLEEMAREMEPDLLAKADEAFAAVAAEHERQTAGFRFECRRWGDFLTVFIERMGNSGVPKLFSGMSETKVATSLSLAGTREIRLVEGHCFDRKGSIRYLVTFTRDDGKGGGWSSSEDWNDPPPKGYHHKLTPLQPFIPTSRPIIAASKDPDGSHWSESFSNEMPYETEGFPRPAEDDQIMFAGIDTTIYAPAGKGRGVYDAIMAEIARGYEPTPLP